MPWAHSISRTLFHALEIIVHRFHSADIYHGLTVPGTKVSEQRCNESFPQGGMGLKPQFTALTPFPLLQLLQRPSLGNEHVLP